ncbi:MAG: prepilin-type N-terminal cleavage/methylation domain-containing protein [Oscillospiraceae bacterium]|nr:prepilin-type N-terminal cleavage/methylation domain-containing protein [Oscillospiraceae bacterium]
MFKYLCKDKKGITLMEMIIAVTIVGFIISIASQLLVNFTRVYNLASRRWEIQSAVQLACTKFEKNRDSIVNAHKADLIYDTALEQGVVYNTETHTITWNQASKVMPAEGIKDQDNIYTYIFSVPATDQNGKALGSFLFIRDFDAENSVLFLDNEGLGEVPVDISFRVATSPDVLDSDTKLPKEEQIYRYLTSTVEIDFKPGLEDIDNYQVITQFTLYNFGGRSMTMEGSYPVLEQSWLNNAYPAGWSAGDDVIGKPDSLVKYLTERNPNKYAPTPVDCSEYLTKDANMMRFVSERAADSKGDVTELTSGVDMASCLTRFLFIDGTKEGARTVGALRDFRDNCLKGTKLGDFIIEKYYNSWSPALVEVCQENPTAAKAIKTMLSSVSKVLGVAACK